MYDCAGVKVLAELGVVVLLVALLLELDKVAFYEAGGTGASGGGLGGGGM